MAQALIKGRAYFDGAGDYLSLASATDFDLSSVANCIEVLVKFNNITSLGMIIDRRDSTTGFGYDMYMSSTGKLTVEWDGTFIESTGVTFNTTNIYHIAMVKSAGSAQLYVDGINRGSISNAVVTNSAIGFYIGKKINRSPIAYDFDGYFYGVKITKGSNRYTTGFTPPTEFVNDANTVLCMNFAETIGLTTFIDETGKTVTTVGNVVIVA